jgi:hypothetical protein
VEFKLRDNPDRTVLPFDQVIESVLQEIESLSTTLDQRLVEIPFPEE